MLRDPYSRPRSERDVSLAPGALDVLFEIIFTVVTDIARLPGKWRAALSTRSSAPVVARKDQPQQ